MKQETKDSLDRYASIRSLARNALNMRDFQRKEPAMTPGRYPEDAFVLFKPGKQWCCVGTDFTSYQSSPIGYGDTMMDATLSYLNVALCRAIAACGESTTPTPPVDIPTPAAI